MVGDWLGLRSRLGFRIRDVSYIIVMMVMTAVVVSVVTVNGERVCMDVRSQVMSGELALTVRATEECG